MWITLVIALLPLIEKILALLGKADPATLTPAQKDRLATLSGYCQALNGKISAMGIAASPVAMQAMAAFDWLSFIKTFLPILQQIIQALQVPQPAKDDSGVNLAALSAEDKRQLGEFRKCCDDLSSALNQAGVQARH